jgi:hypothetical protein
MTNSATTLLSLTEIEALCRKAARGAGCPWGMAEEAGKAARWLAGHGLPGPESLAALLDTPRNCRCGEDDSGPGCALALGTRLTDDAETIVNRGAIDFGTVSHPLLMVAQAGYVAAALNVPLTIGWEGFRATCSPAGLSLECAEARDEPAAMGVAVALSASPGTPRPPEARARAVTAVALERLERLAALTYAPATDASRTSGAGASNLDKE